MTMNGTRTASAQEHIWRASQCLFLRLDREDSENQIVERLIQFRKSHLHEKMIHFKVHDIQWTERIRHEMILTFEHYVNSGRQWHEALFDEHSHDEQEMSFHLQLVLEAPVTFQLFRKVIYQNHLSRLHGQIERQVAIALSIILRNGRHLDMVEVGKMNTWSTSDLSVRLAEGCNVTLVASSFALPRPDFPGPIYSQEEGSSPEYERKGAEFYFHFSTPNLTDAEASLLVRSLISHRTLRKLILSHIDFGDATTRAICRLLATPTCQLVHLQLSDHYIQHLQNYSVDFQRLVERLPTNTSLQSLVFGFPNTSIDNDSGNLLLRSLGKFPNLRCLRWGAYGSRITDFVHLASNVRMTFPHSRLRILDIGWIRMMTQLIGDVDSTARAILHLLDVFPELCDLGPEFDCEIRDKVLLATILVHRLDLNRCCGMLLRGAPLPLSIWPVVLAKATRNQHISDSRRANVIYRMLHGPVFAGRGSLD